MNKFKVGDRVRAISVPHVMATGVVQPGATGTIASEMLPDNGSHTDRYIVSWDDGRELPRHAECIEPIDDDFRAGSWDEICALTRGWRPGVGVHS